MADLNRREINVYFKLIKFDARKPAAGAQKVVNEYRFRVPFVQLTRVFRVVNGECLSFVVSLDLPPLYHRKLLDQTCSFSDGENIWRGANSWFRQTDIVHSHQDLTHAAVSLRKNKSIIDIGEYDRVLPLV